MNTDDEFELLFNEQETAQIRSPKQELMHKRFELPYLSVYAVPDFAKVFTMVAGNSLLIKLPTVFDLINISSMDGGSGLSDMGLIVSFTGSINPLAPLIVNNLENANNGFININSRLYDAKSITNIGLLCVFTGGTSISVSISGWKV